MTWKEGELAATRLRELAADEKDPKERERLLEAAAEADGDSLNGAGFARPSSDPLADVRDGT